MATPIEEKLRTLAVAELLQAQAATRLTVAKEAALATPEAQTYQTLLDAQKTLTEAVSMADADVRREMMVYFQVTGDKKPTPGIEVQLRKKIVFDQDVVMDWLAVNAPTLIVHKIASGFEKVAVQLGAPVTVEYEPFVKLASNLRGYLPGELLVASEVQETEPIDLS